MLEKGNRILKHLVATLTAQVAGKVAPSEDLVYIVGLTMILAG